MPVKNIMHACKRERLQPSRAAGGGGAWREGGGGNGGDAGDERENSP